MNKFPDFRTRLSRRTSFQAICVMTLKRSEEYMQFYWLSNIFANCHKPHWDGLVAIKTITQILYSTAKIEE